jgi:hypothetical protein
MPAGRLIVGLAVPGPKQQRQRQTLTSSHVVAHGAGVVHVL